MICEPSIYKYFNDTSERKKAIAKACRQQTARVIMTNMNRRRKKKGHYRIQPGTGTVRHSLFPDEMKKSQG
jgi:hypothetical protein